MAHLPPGHLGDRISLRSIFKPLQKYISIVWFIKDRVRAWISKLAIGEAGEKPSGYVDFDRRPNITTGDKKWQLTVKFEEPA